MPNTILGCPTNTTNVIISVVARVVA